MSSLYFLSTTDILKKLMCNQGENSNPCAMQNVRFSGVSAIPDSEKGGREQNPLEASRSVSLKYAV